VRAEAAVQQLGQQPLKQPTLVASTIAP